jgi:histidyl-tRNA synthetase
MNSDKSKRVKPELLKGFRDYGPEEELTRRDLIERIREVFERHGYLPLQTPALEFLTTLFGADYGKENKEQIFNFVGPDDVEMGLRFDLTAPLARFVAANRDLPTPFRRYQVAPCWRVDKPGPGRYREFLQFDIDIVGTSLVAADAEIIAIMVETMNHLGIERAEVRYSDRKILDGLAEYAGILIDMAPDVFRVLDKLDKQGREAVILELGPGRVDKSGDKIAGLGLPDSQIAHIERFLDIAKLSPDEQMREAAELLAGIDSAEEGLDELRHIRGFLDSMGVDPVKARIDLAVVRGLGYYTGPVFETFLLDLPEYGSVFSGGRYDHLVSRFSGQPMPGTGSSIGPDRLLAALLKLQAIETRRSCADVLVTTMDKTRMNDYFRIAGRLREAGFRVEIFLGNNRRVPKQLQYADRLDIPVAVICGSDEFERDEVTIKDLVAGREQSKEVRGRAEWLKAEDIQVTLPSEKMVDHIRAILTRERG